jgi:hypothetical protein
MIMAGMSWQFLQVAGQRSVLAVFDKSNLLRFLCSFLGSLTWLRQLEDRTMSDRRFTDRYFELITTTMNELANEVGKMEPDDPNRTYFLEELSILTQFLNGAVCRPRSCRLLASSQWLGLSLTVSSPSASSPFLSASFRHRRLNFPRSF